MPEICSCCHRELSRLPDREYIAVFGDGSEHKMCVFCYTDTILAAQGRKEPTPKQRLFFPAIHEVVERKLNT